MTAIACLATASGLATMYGGLGRTAASPVQTRHHTAGARVTTRDLLAQVSTLIAQAGFNIDIR